MTTNKSDQDKAIESIVKQWNGGEHMLAGARASELVFGASRKMNEKLFDDLRIKIPGIERYLSAPVGGEIVTMVEDQGGNPLATQPENTKEASSGPSNTSSDEAKSEQDAIDDALAAGREARPDAESLPEIGSTQLNPPASNIDPATTKPGRKGKAA